MIRGYDGVRFIVPNTPLVRGIVFAGKVILTALALAFIWWGIIVPILCL